MKPLRTLYSKLALSLIVLLCLVGLFYALMSQTLLERSYLSGYQQLNRQLAADLSREMALVENGRINRNTMHDVFHVMMLVNPSIEIYYLDLQGNIIDFSAEPEKIKDRRVDLRAIELFFAGESMYPIKGTDPRNPDILKPFSVAPLPSAENPQGYLYVVLQSAQFDEFQLRAQSAAMHTLGMWALSGSLAIGLVLGLVLFYRLTRRIRRLNNAVDTFRDSGFSGSPGDFNLRDSGNDEIAQLVHSFEQMAEHIARQYTSLEKQDKLRRDMVANVSHDLRTPLAALHGYLERLKDKFDETTPEERRQFLNVSVDHSARLNRLIDDLFELSKLDAQEVQPQLEPFLLSELVQDVLQKFRLTAADRNIKLRFMYSKQLPLISGDIALLDRALSNLVDNALEHTPEGGKVTLTVEDAGDRVSVKIKDNGKGIAKQHLPVIFQRFYRADQQRLGSGKHAGLGLAITHRILELHGQAIRVRSKLNHGTTFQFFMPVWQRDQESQPGIATA